MIFVSLPFSLESKWDALFWNNSFGTLYLIVPWIPDSYVALTFSAKHVKYLFAATHAAAASFCYVLAVTQYFQNLI